MASNGNLPAVLSCTPRNDSGLCAALLCSQCHRVFSDPVMLCCGHSFCKICVQKQWARAEEPRCPTCMVLCADRRYPDKRALLEVVRAVGDSSPDLGHIGVVVGECPLVRSSNKEWNIQIKGRSERAAAVDSEILAKADKQMDVVTTEGTTTDTQPEGESMGDPNGSVSNTRMAGQGTTTYSQPEGVSLVDPNGSVSYTKKAGQGTTTYTRSEVMSMRDPNGSVLDTRMAGQTKKPQEMKSPQPPVCIIENIDGQLRPCESGLKILESIELPLVVVAVFGMYRTGKSYLMNRLCNKKQGFSLGFTIRPHTKGIWMWGLPHPRNPEYCLLLLDTEGMGDTKKGDETSDKWLFLLSLLMSSLFIYNSMKQIDQHAMSDLHIVTKLKNFIKIKTQTNDSKEEDELWKTCLPFVWVIRDFCLEMEIDGKEVTADEYLEHCLLPNQEKNKEYNECRKCITELFPDRKCFIFPQPTTKVKHLRNLENIADSELDEDFVAEITKLRDYVYSRAEPRIVQGVPLNGRMLSTLLQTFTECISRGDAPSLQTIVQSMADRENSKVVAAADTCYRESMDKLVLPVKDAFKLQQHHIESERKAFDVFKQLYFPDKDYKFQNELKVKLQTLLQQYCKRNKEESEKKCRTILTHAFKKVEEKHMNGEYAKPGGYRKYIADWNLAEEEYLSTKGKGPKGEKVLLEFKKNKAGEANLLAMDEYLYWKTKELEAEKQSVTITVMEEKLLRDEITSLLKQKEMEETNERKITDLIQTVKQKFREEIEALMQSALEKKKH